MLLWSQMLLTLRNFSTWIGLEPKQHSSGGNDRLGGTTLHAYGVD